MHRLTVSRSMQGGVVLVRPDGLLDVTTYPVLRDELLKCAAEVPDGIVVDLSCLTADRVTSLSVFPTVWLRISPWPDIPMVLAGAATELSALLGRSAVARFVPVHHSVTAALDDLGRRPRRRRAHRLFPTGAAAPGEAREWARSAVGHWELTDPAEILVVVSELVTNAVVHTATDEIGVRLELRLDRLSVAVQDGDPTAPAQLSGGRVGGLSIVDAFARVWGHSRALPAGKVVWAVLPVRGQQL